MLHGTLAKKERHARRHIMTYSIVLLVLVLVFSSEKFFEAKKIL